MAAAKKKPAEVIADPLDIPSFLFRKAWSKQQEAERTAALARYPVTSLNAKGTDMRERKALQDVCVAVEGTLRRMSFEAQELAAREILPIFSMELSLDELRLMIDDRLPGALKDEEDDDRLRGSARERVAQEVATSVGHDALTLHELRKRLPLLDSKDLRSGLRRALATSLLFQRKDGGRFVYTTIAGRKGAQAQETAPESRWKPAAEGDVPRRYVATATGSKKAVIAALLLRPEGCTTADVLAATGWPAVSMPAQSKAAGLTLRKEKNGTGPARYYGKKD
jgi:hypothetical protein